MGAGDPFVEHNGEKGDNELMFDISSWTTTKDGIFENYNPNLADLEGGGGGSSVGGGGDYTFVDKAMNLCHEGEMTLKPPRITHDDNGDDDGWSSNDDMISTTMTTGSQGGDGGGEEKLLRKGPWTAAEDVLLLKVVEELGPGDWVAIERYSGLARTSKSCRLRWTNHLRPNLKKGSFTLEEERHVVKMHYKYGNKWSRMARHLPGRTDNEIKNFWHSRVKKCKKQGLPIYPEWCQEEKEVWSDEEATTQDFEPINFSNPHDEPTTNHPSFQASSHDQESLQYYSNQTVQPNYNNTPSLTYQTYENPNSEFNPYQQTYHSVQNSIPSSETTQYYSSQGQCYVYGPRYISSLDHMNRSVQAPAPPAQPSEPHFQFYPSMPTTFAPSSAKQISGFKRLRAPAGPTPPGQFKRVHRPTGQLPLVGNPTLSGSATSNSSDSKSQEFSLKQNPSSNELPKIKSSASCPDMDKLLSCFSATDSTPQAFLNLKASAMAPAPAPQEPTLIQPPRRDSNPEMNQYWDLSDAQTESSLSDLHLVKGYLLSKQLKAKHLYGNMLAQRMSKNISLRKEDTPWREGSSSEAMLSNIPDTNPNYSYRHQTLHGSNFSGSYVMPQMKKDLSRNIVNEQGLQCEVSKTGVLLVENENKQILLSKFLKRQNTTSSISQHNGSLPEGIKVIENSIPDVSCAQNPVSDFPELMRESSKDVMWGPLANHGEDFVSGPLFEEWPENLAAEHIETDQTAINSFLNDPTSQYIVPGSINSTQPGLESSSSQTSLGDQNLTIEPVLVATEPRLDPVINQTEKSGEGTELQIETKNPSQPETAPEEFSDEQYNIFPGFDSLLSPTFLFV